MAKRYVSMFSEEAERMRDEIYEEAYQQRRAQEREERLRRGMKKSEEDYYGRARYAWSFAR